MTAKYYALLTNLGVAKLANATALGTQLSLTQMAVGDGGGILPTPDPAQTKLIGEKRRAALNSLSVDPANTNQIIAEQIIPEDQGGFWIREIGLFDQDNTLIAIANCPETYKPQLQEGSGRTQTVRMILVVSNTDTVTLKIDPSVVLATRKYVDDKVIEVKAYADDLMAKHLAAVNPHSQYLQVSKNLIELKNAGPEAVAAALTNLGLGEAATRNVGSKTDMAAGNSDALLPSVSAVMSLFNKRTFSTIDYIRIPDVPGGLILQWGEQALVNGTGQVKFPIVFPKAILRCFAGDSSSASWSSTNFTIFGPATPTLSGVSIKAVTLAGTSFTQGNTATQWFAIGY